MIFRVILWTNSCSISVSPLRFISNSVKMDCRYTSIVQRYEHISMIIIQERGQRCCPSCWRTCRTGGSGPPPADRPAERQEPPLRGPPTQEHPPAAPVLHNHRQVRETHASNQEQKMKNILQEKATPIMFQTCFSLFTPSPPPPLPPPAASRSWRVIGRLANKGLGEVLHSTADARMAACQRLANKLQHKLKNSHPERKNYTKTAQYCTLGWVNFSESEIIVCVSWKISTTKTKLTIFNFFKNFLFCKNL